MKSQPKTATAPFNASAVPTIAKSASKKPTKKSSAKKAEASGKLGKVVALLKRPKGASIVELMRVTGWQAHSVRGAIFGTITKKQKLTVLSEKTGDVRCYRIKS